MKAEELKIKKLMENGHYGYGVQFVYDYNVELTKLNDLIVTGYDELLAKFKNIYKEYKGTDWKETVIVQHPSAQTQIENKKKRKTADETLIKETKKKTKKKQAKKESELGAKAEELLDLKNVVSNATELFSENLSKVTISNKTEYVSTTTTSTAGGTRKKSSSKKSKSSLNKNESIIKKTVIQTQVILEKDDDENEEEIDEKDEKLVEEQSEPVNNPSKKLRLTIKQENNHSETIVKPQDDVSEDGSSETLSLSKANKKTKRTKSKKKLSKIKHSKGGTEDIFRMPVPLAQSSLSLSKISDSTIISSNVADLKTPSKAQTNEKRLEKIMESNSKTIKANVQVEKTNQSNQQQQQQQVKPMTRRAAAAAAAAANSTAPVISSSLKVKTAEAPSVGGKVKQMIEAVEARMKTVQNTPGSALKQNAASSSSLLKSTIKPVQAAQTLSKTQSTTNTNANKDGKLRSSIDKRKERISLSKAEQKRQSIKRVNAFLKDITEQTPSNQNEKNTTQTNTVINTQAKLASATKPSSVRVKLFPTEPSAQNATSNINNITSTSNDSSIMSVKNLIVNSSTVQQNYRVAPQTVKSTPAVRKQSFVKFLERNTPSKMTKTELEEKRKIELLFKEKKEQERLHEREKLLQEKIEISKKKREEKMKKIEELKVKKQEEDQKKKEELEAKMKEAEENKKRILEEKKREELEKQKAKEQRLAQEKPIASATVQATSSATTPAILSSNTITSSSSIVAQNYQQQSANKPHVHKVQLINSNQANLKMNNENQVPLASNSSSSNHDNMSTFKPVKPMSFNNPLQPVHMNKPTASGSHNVPLETTYLLKATSHQMNSHHMENYVKSKMENYDISDLNSEDETDDEEEPSKPIPAWAKDPILINTAISQNHRMINFTKLFKASSQNEIDLHAIFKIKRKKFDERSSSANWSTPPIWLTNGINGNESFRQLHK